MKHLKHYAMSPLDFISRVIDSKKDHRGDDVIRKERERCKATGLKPPAVLMYKERCAEIRDRNKAEINKYQTAFDADNLTDVPKGVPVSLNGAKKDCEDMKELYAFRGAELGKLWAEVLSEDDYLDDICPICESVKATSFDHYLPKTEYQLFSVHPLNLIPCCTVCNGHKLKRIFDGKNKRKYWNAYLDENTTERYLYCDITEENGMPKASFRVEQGNLPNRYYEIVKNSFDDLELNKNYQESSGRIIKDLKKSCCQYYIKNSQLGFDVCLQHVGETIPDTEVNNWANVLKKALIDTDIFKSFVKTALKQEYRINC